MVGINMKMPGGCSECRFCHCKSESKYICYAAKIPFSFGMRAWTTFGRPKRCPLVLVVKEKKI